MAKIEKLQYITDGTPAQIIASTENFLKGGGKWVQLRFKNGDDQQFLECGKEVKRLCREYGATFLINDRVDICLELDADGVHIGKEDMAVEEARKILGSSKIIGRTCNTLQDIEQVLGSGADYLGVGPFRFTTTKKKLSPVLGIEGYKPLVEAATSKLPIIAVGGITSSDIKPLLEAGVYGIALSSTITKAEDVAAKTAQILTNF